MHGYTPCGKVEVLKIIYSEGICQNGAAILKDGHTMFIEDVVKDLNRKAFLEEKNTEMKEAMQEFVDRVDINQIKSKKTYTKFKKILSV